MALIDFVEWRNEGGNVYAWHFPENNLSTATQLVVREGQEAVLFSSGRILGKFGPGRHVLSTENLPVLRSLYGIPFGNRNPFTSEVWFVNKVSPLVIDWKTPTFRILDSDYGQMMPLTANGRYGLKVTDAEKFLVKLVGTAEVFDSFQLTNHFMGPLSAKTNSSIAAFMSTNRIGINQIASQLDNLSKFIEQPMSEFWLSYGLSLTGFYITSIDLDTSTKDGEQIAQAMSDRSAQKIAGYTWQQKQSFGVANEALTKGGNMGLLGAMMMTGFMGGGSGSIANGMMNVSGSYDAPASQPQFQQSQQPVRKKEVFCSNCAKKYDASSKFCPYCGDPYNPCPMCGNDNPIDARRCTFCGAELVSAIPAGVTADKCARCGQPMPSGVKFCPNCGCRK